jgi:hypothetical protein
MPTNCTRDASRDIKPGSQDHPGRSLRDPRRAGRGSTGRGATSGSVHTSFSVRLKCRFPAPAISLSGTVRSFGQDLARQRQPQKRRGLDRSEHGVTLKWSEATVLAGSWFFPRSAGSRNMASGRSAPLCPERGHRRRAATRGTGLPGLVPAGTCSRLHQADLDGSRGLTITRQLGRRPNQSRGRPSRPDA